MTWRVAEILLISSTYDAYILQEDGPLAERIIHEYRGLNLSRPPRLTWMSSAEEALFEIASGEYDMVIVMPHIGDMDSLDLCAKIKERRKDLPVYYFAYDAGHFLEEKKYFNRDIIDRTLLWSGTTDLLMALVKNLEDQRNVASDTDLAQIRVIIFVEDSPFYLSSLLPVLYRELVLQTQAVMDDSLNDKDRLLRMRTRPKILVAENYEEAWSLYLKYKKFLFCVISDVRFEMDGQEHPRAGIQLLQDIHREMNDLPLLMLSSEPENREEAEAIPALFFDKNSPRLHQNIELFFSQSLGFGDFLFRLENGEIAGRAANLRSMAKTLVTVPHESLSYHARRNDFSRWLMARYEMEIASRIRVVMLDDFDNVEGARHFLINVIREKLKKRQQGLVTDFVQDEFDSDTDFVKIGKGSLGGKGRGLAFISNLLREEQELIEQFTTINFSLPKTVVITTEGFDLFARNNQIFESLSDVEDDDAIQRTFLNTHFPEELQTDLLLFLTHTNYPLAVRSSAILEDAHYRASAGAYTTYMLPNNDADIQIRLQQLIRAIKLVYSSIFQEIPRMLAQNSVYRQEEDKMAVIIQQLIGKTEGNLYYPAISGVAQSYNFYPVSYMQPDEGVAHIALGLGKTVVEGGAALRFSPKYPQILPQFSNLDDILQNSQKYFYALHLGSDANQPLESMIQRINIDQARNHYAIEQLASTFNPEDQRLRDCLDPEGFPVITFASVLKFENFPLGRILSILLEIGEKGMGCPVELEFAVNLQHQSKPHFYLLQIRPMVVAQNRVDISISQEERDNAWCFSDKTMGRSQEKHIHTILYVRPENFDTAKTRVIAKEIEAANSRLKGEQKQCLLIGPGRWGTTDRWLGIPINWSGITQAHTIIETNSEKLQADPSQGSHFFHNITSLGINYLGVTPRGESRIDLQWLDSEKAELETEFIRLVNLPHPTTLKIDGKQSHGILLPPESQRTG